MIRLSSLFNNTPDFYFGLRKKRRKVFNTAIFCLFVFISFFVLTQTSWALEAKGPIEVNEVNVRNQLTPEGTFVIRYSLVFTEKLQGGRDFLVLGPFEPNRSDVSFNCYQGDKKEEIKITKYGSSYYRILFGEFTKKDAKYRIEAEYKVQMPPEHTMVDGKGAWLIQWSPFGPPAPAEKFISALILPVSLPGGGQSSDTITDAQVEEVGVRVDKPGEFDSLIYFTSPDPSGKTLLSVHGTRRNVLPGERVKIKALIPESALSIKPADVEKIRIDLDGRMGGSSKNGESAMLFIGMFAIFLIVVFFITRKPKFVPDEIKRETPQGEIDADSFMEKEVVESDKDQKEGAEEEPKEEK